MAPAPVHVSSLPICRLAGSRRTYPPSKGFTFRKHAAVKRSPCSILKKSQQRGTPKKRVRFSLPGERNAAGDDSSSHFKGFTTADMDKLRISIENIKGLQESLTLRQKIAVEETMYRKNGAIPIKVGKRKGYLCRKKFDDCTISKIGKVTKTGNCSAQDTFPYKQLLELESRKMECRICSRVAYIPVTQHQPPEGGTSKYFCNDCFERSAMCTISPAAPQRNVLKTGVALRNPPAVTTTAEQVSDLLEESQIIISSVCSLADTLVCDGPDKLEKQMDELFGDEGRHFISPVKMEEQKPEISSNSEPYGHQVNIEVIPNKKLGGKTKTVTLWTAEGPFTVHIPCSEEERYVSMTDALYNKKWVGCSHEDPICIDNI